MELDSSNKRLVRCDMHVHSWHSKGYLVNKQGSSEGNENLWHERILKGLRDLIRVAKGKSFHGPESWSLYFRSGFRPEDLYETARKNGMDFFCLTDYDCIDGWVELLSNHPGLEPYTIRGVEIPLRIPQGSIHVNAYDIDEGQFREMQKHRGNPEEFFDYCNENGILYSYSHPVYPWFTGSLKSRLMRLSQKDLEKLLERFPVIEARNGLCRKEDNARIESYCNERRKGMTGGSDSSTRFVGRTWTGVNTDKRNLTKKEFLNLIREGKSVVGGRHGGIGAVKREIATQAETYDGVWYNYGEGDTRHEWREIPFGDTFDKLIRYGVKLFAPAVAGHGPRS